MKASEFIEEQAAQKPKQSFSDRARKIAETRADECAKITRNLILEAWPQIAKAMAESEESNGKATVSFKFIGDMSKPIIHAVASVPNPHKIEHDDVQGADPDQMTLTFEPREED